MEQSRRFGISNSGRAKMRHALKPELLAAMKQLLRNLDKVKIISPDDIEILRLRRALHQKIDGLETDGLLDEHSDGQMAA